MVYEKLKSLFESEDKKLIREVVETDPKVMEFIGSHVGCKIKRDKKFLSKSMLKSLKDCQMLMDVEDLMPAAQASYQEEMHALLRSGGHPPSLADYAHPENLALFEVRGAPELAETKPGEWIYNYKNFYRQDVLRVYVEPVEKKVVGTTSFVRTYAKHENVLPAKQVLGT